ncbi:MAG TPA: SDR family oxidoreductase [Bryobacteraceae bacterium]
MTEPCLLLTGASGLVGSAWLPWLLENYPDRRIVILSRSPQRSIRPKNNLVTIVRGDLTQRNLGLAVDDQKALSQSITEIIHCAADIRFRLPLGEARATNLAGTRRLLALARRSKYLEKFAHISTVYVAGRQRGMVPEARFRNTSGFLNSYQQSKYEAEQLVFEAMPEIPASIFRLSSIISDSNGNVRQSNYFHQVLRLVPRNPFPVIPGESGAPLDLIASDWAASALAVLYDSHFTPGRVYHVCAGAEASMSVGEILDRTFRILNERRRAQAVPPRLVGLDEFERFARQQAKSASSSVKKLLGVIQEFLPQLAIPQCYENRATMALLERAGLQLPPVREYYARVVESCFGGRSHEV